MSGFGRRERFLRKPLSGKAGAVRATLPHRSARFAGHVRGQR